MSDPLLIALFDAAVSAARGEDLLIANSEVGPSAWRYSVPADRSMYRCRNRVAAGFW